MVNIIEVVIFYTIEFMFMDFKFPIGLWWMKSRVVAVSWTLKIKIINFKKNYRSS